jgi:hypothetical protein
MTVIRALREWFRGDHPLLERKRGSHNQQLIAEFRAHGGVVGGY